MPFPSFVARALAQRLLDPDRYRRLERLAFVDEGHGYDAFGMHPDFVALGAGLTSFLHRRYFRVVSRGIEHVPASGPVILAANHSGTLPLDAVMLWCDVVLRTEPPRTARPVADYFVPMLPWVGLLFTRAGMVGGSRGNVRKLLEAGNMLMVFPEGVPGVGKLFRDRYLLQEWRVGHAELAIRHGAPVVPVGIVGAEEQMPQVGRIRGVNLFGIPYLPVTLSPFPLPVRYHVTYGPPVRLDQLYRPEQADDPDVLAEAAGRVRDAVRDLIHDGLSRRAGVFR